jgi:hypothetical protein
VSEYAQLVALAEREATLLAAGAWEDLPGLAAERSAIVAALPAAPPAAARPHLERLAGLQQLNSAALGAARAETARELRQLGQGRGAVRGYAASAGRRAAAGQLA